MDKLVTGSKANTYYPDHPHPAKVLPVVAPSRGLSITIGSNIMTTHTPDEDVGGTSR